MSEDNSAEYGLVKSFGIDNGELDGLSSQKCFVLGYELCQVDTALVIGGPISRAVHAENQHRIADACRDKGRKFTLSWMTEDPSESWMWLEVEDS